MINEIFAACEDFKMQNYKMNYDKFGCTCSLSVSNLNDWDKKNSNNQLNLQEFLDFIGMKFLIKVYFIDKNGKLWISKSSGEDFFIASKACEHTHRDTSDHFLYHGNGGRFSKLPAGVNKSIYPYHKFNEIMDLIDVKTSYKTCPLSISNIDLLQEKFKVNIDVWEKFRVQKKFFYNHLKSSHGQYKKSIQLHYDKTTEKLFLITDPKLYFRQKIKVSC